MMLQRELQRERRRECQLYIEIAARPAAEGGNSSHLILSSLYGEFFAELDEIWHLEARISREIRDITKISFYVPACILFYKKYKENDRLIMIICVYMWHKISKLESLNLYISMARKEIWNCVPSIIEISCLNDDSESNVGVMKLSIYEIK